MANKKKIQVKITPLDLVLECTKAAKEFKEVLYPQEKPVTMVLYMMPELRAYRKNKKSKPVDYSYPLYRFFQHGKPDAVPSVLLPKIKELTQRLKEQRI